MVSTATAFAAVLGIEYESEGDRVYISSDRTIARAFAALYFPESGGWGTGTLYRVAPTGALELDPDFPGGGRNFSTTAATVLEVEETSVARDVLTSRESLLAALVGQGQHRGRALSPSRDVFRVQR
ncbi:hypothetical protein G3T36_07620 [Diaminobutyricibacter tongyongensis]|uniref:Uncharacterized protein n=1 Tax=Leifsonia tongyongensis TaxID=1268043 RepID=A0A6L9XWE0_9MICO|nr:hypothetical protein [Diaminobutyricibacter tongyongensis]NEN05739.1 hypothetical protein [Diaminobutyricibacter tongyongensis]